MKWTPIPDGSYDSIDISENGERLTIHDTDANQKQVQMSAYTDELRLCRQVPGEASVPVEIMNTMRDELIQRREFVRNVYNLNHPDNAKRLEGIDRVLAWLDTLKGGE